MDSNRALGNEGLSLLLQNMQAKSDLYPSDSGGPALTATPLARSRRLVSVYRSISSAVRSNVRVMRSFVFH
ncbi:hypothetical protein BQ8794_110158 [Mesorhizobium prunaredense]|uniref:Uncharacterized protein n=1 Tax=Mesorhizobium prunaredense TaxID=1631249 RepID=A0A1R3V0E4_9HYPH|nr:hypothetical protein BQ8794_110158 [Mesorhizobium prunaredense]